MPAGAGQRAGTGSCGSPALGARVSACGSAGWEGLWQLSSALALPRLTQGPAQKGFSNCRLPSVAPAGWSPPGSKMLEAVEGRGSCLQFSRGSGWTAQETSSCRGGIAQPGSSALPQHPVHRAGGGRCCCLCPCRHWVLQRV